MNNQYTLLMNRMVTYVSDLLASSIALPMFLNPSMNLFNMIGCSLLNSDIIETFKHPSISLRSLSATNSVIGISLLSSSGSI